MLLQRIIAWLTGYVEILARGPFLEKFINLLTGSGLWLWDVRRLGPEVIHAKLRAHGFLRIRRCAKTAGATVRLHRKRGVPFIWRKIQRRRTFLVGSGLFVAALIYLSSLVMVVKISGFEGEDRIRLLATLHQMGVRPGAARREILAQKRMLEREVMLRTPHAVWFGLEVRGVVAEVTVVKRKTAPIRPESYDLVAARDGLVTKVAVIRGTAAVREGQTVAAGDLLIAGNEWQTDKASGEMVQKKVPAGGIVEARVWYDLEVTEPKTGWMPVTGRAGLVVYSVRWGGKLYPLLHFGKRPAGPASWTRQRKRIFRGRNPGETVEIIKDIWRETHWRRLQRTSSELERAARREIEAKLNYLPGAKAGSLVETWVDDGNFRRLMVTIETIQDIAMIAPPRKEP